jgi:hypothetical protein
MTIDLLTLINLRQKQHAEFNYGIQTADRYVSTLATCVGSDLCYRYGSTKSVSFNDALKRAGRTLTYSNPDMQLKDVYSESMPEGIEIPKHALMVFKHVLTTPRKDRDGDILRTKGARPDPAMLMLWQHVHTLPIGKSLGVAEHNEKQLVMYSAIVDVNELAQDAAVMIANKMGRFSHGFKALEFSAIKEGKAVPGKTSGEKGFDVTRFEIMEESLVSVPANVDAETLEVYLDLIEGEKLTSSIMKSYGKKLRSTRSDRFPGMSLGEKHGTADEKGKPEGSCGCNAPAGKPCGCDGKKPPSEKTDGDADETEPTDDKGTENDKGVTECPECGVELEEGECPECGYVAPEPKEKPKEEVEAEKSFDEDPFGEKAGRVLSKGNYATIKEVHDSMSEMHEQCSTRSGKALCQKCQMSLKSVLDSAAKEEPPEPEVEKSVTFSDWLANSTPEDRKRVKGVLEAMDTVDSAQRFTKSFRQSVKKGVAIKAR